VALLIFAVSEAQISCQFVLRCWEQHGIAIAAQSARAVPASIEAITRTRGHVIVGLIFSFRVQYTASRWKIQGNGSV
jgi:hypothetical protein